MWEYIVLGIFIILLQLLLIMFGGWLINFIFGLVCLGVAYRYFELIGSGLPLDYILPLIMILFTILLWISALIRSDTI